MKLWVPTKCIKPYQSSFLDVSHLLQEDDCLFRCCCGQLVAQHGPVVTAAKEEATTPLVQLEVQPTERWSPLRHTQTSPTDAYGLLEFQGSGHVNKAAVLTLAVQFEYFDAMGFLLNP